MDDLYAVILAAGKGKRMNSTDRNKVTLEVAGKPMILRTIDTLKESGVKNILVVVGFAKESVTSILPNDVQTVEQVEQQGTSDAVKAASPKIPEDAKYILVLYGDDSYVYTPEHFQNLYKNHLDSNSEITFLTTEKDNLEGMGRVIRDINGDVLGIVEDKVASEEQKKVREINLGGFLFNGDFLKQNVDKIKKNEETGEYFITDIIEIAKKQNLAVSALKLDNLKWRGINTPEELEEAQGILNE